MRTSTKQAAPARRASASVKTAHSQGDAITITLTRDELLGFCHDIASELACDSPINPALEREDDFPAILKAWRECSENCPDGGANRQTHDARADTLERLLPHLNCDAASAGDEEADLFAVKLPRQIAKVLRLAAEHYGMTPEEFIACSGAKSAAATFDEAHGSMDDWGNEAAAANSSHPDSAAS